MRVLLATLSLCLVTFLATSAQAHTRHHHHGHHHHHVARAHKPEISHQAAFDAIGDAILSAVPRQGLVTVQTAAGIPIKVSSNFAPKIQGFIRDIVAEGYHPRHIGCFATGGHVRHSLHYSGNACDFDQTGWGKTAAAMYHVQALTEKWGLRNGCSFSDCGHIDTGFGFARHRLRHYARG